MTICIESTVVRNNEAIFSSIDDEAVIMNMAKNAYIGLDSVGARIWELLKSPLRVDLLCEQLSQEYEVSLEQIQSGVLPFLVELEGDGLLHCQQTVEQS